MKNSTLRIKFDKFIPRWYQEEVQDAYFNHDFTKIMVINARRSGKDINFWDIAIKQAVKEIGLVLYCLPTFASGRRIIWDAIATDGTKFIDYVPKDLIASINNQQMKITLTNGSIISVIGAEDCDRSLVGTNAKLIIFSEFALMRNGEQAFSMARPIIAANGGKILICSTPRGKNHMYHLYNKALTLPDWHVIKRGTSGPDGTNHIPPAVLAQEKAQMDPGLYEQEFEVSWEKGIEGQIFGRALDLMTLENRVTSVPYMPEAPTYVVMDIGYNDSTAIIWYQVIDNGNQVRVIDYYTNNFLGMDHYVKIIREKPYVYDNDNSFWAPHDIHVHEFGNAGISRLQMASGLGVNFNVIPIKGFDKKTGLQEGINVVWQQFTKIWIDNRKCKSLVSALENYRREWNEEHQVYADNPVKNWACHGSDAFRYMCLTLGQLKTGMALEDFERARARARYGNDPMQMLQGNRQIR